MFLLGVGNSAQIGTVSQAWCCPHTTASHTDHTAVSHKLTGRCTSLSVQHWPLLLASYHHQKYITAHNTVAAVEITQLLIVHS